MNELELLGPRAYGDALGRAVLKATAEDFQVDEVLDIPLSGDGEHLWLWVEKRGLNTEEAARRLARAAGVQLRTVSYAGLKDRQALTRQWFSIQLPGKADPDLSAAQDDTLKILKSGRHKRKLQRGAHAANGFTLRLTQLDADQGALNQRLETIARQGIPNYFGTQRFGYQGGNLGEARDYAARKALPEQRAVRSRLLSTARSYLFNRVLAARVADGSWQKAQVGDLLAFTDSRSFSRPDWMNAAILVWRSSICTPPVLSGVKALRQLAVRRQRWKIPLPMTNPCCVTGWSERAWSTNVASCDCPLGG